MIRLPVPIAAQDDKARSLSVAARFGPLGRGIWLVLALAIASPIVLRALGWFGAEGRDVVSAESVDGVAPSSSGVNKPAAEADSKSTRWSPAVTDDDSFTVVEGDAALRDGVLELKLGWRAKDALLSLDRVPTDNVTLRGELLLSAWYQGAGVRLDCGGTFVEARLNSGVNPRAEGRVMNYRLYLQDAAGEHSRRNVGELGEDAGEQRWMRFEWSRQGQRVTFKVDDHPTHVLDNTGLTPVGPIMLNTWNKPATFRRLEYRVLDDVVAASRERE